MKKKKTSATTAKAHNKGNKYFEAQKKTVYKALCEYPMTSLMIANYTGILRANITRYIAELTEEDKIMVVDKKLCPITKHRASFYAAIRELF